jgi:hypothetical protein
MLKMQIALHHLHSLIRWSLTATPSNRQLNNLTIPLNKQTLININAYDRKRYNSKNYDIKNPY